MGIITAKSSKKFLLVTEDSTHNLTFYFAGMRNHFTEHPLRVETCLKPVCVSAAPTKQHHGIVSHMTVVLFTTCRPTHTLNIQSQICLGNQQYMKRHQGTRTLWDNTRQDEDHVMSAVWTTFWIFLNMFDSWTVRGFKSEYFNRPQWGKTRTNHTPFCVKYRTTTYFSSISSEELSWAPFLIAVYQTCTSILWPAGMVEVV